MTVRFSIKGTIAVVLATVLLCGAGAPAANTGGCTPRWRAVASGPRVPLFHAVAAVSHTNVWAVGYTENSARVIQSAAIAHWNGRALSVSRLFPASANRDSGELFDVAVPRAGDVWIVGSDGAHGVVLRSAGGRWRVKHVRATWFAIAAPSQKDVWIVGSERIGHIRNGIWRTVVVRGAVLSAVDRTSPTDVWAVGDNDTSVGSTNDIDGVIVHFDGRRWHRVRAPVPDDSDLGVEAVDDFDAVDAQTPSNAWAVHSGVIRSDVQHWNGHAWRVAIRLSGQLRDLAVRGRVGWAVGYAERADRTIHPLVLRAAPNGHWSRFATTLGRLEGSLNGLSVVSGKEIWAAGDHVLAVYSCQS